MYVPGCTKFFITGKRFLSAAVKRERYEENTIESLSDIKLQCEQLLQEAEKSNKYQMLHTTKAIMDRESTPPPNTHTQFL